MRCPPPPPPHSHQDTQTLEKSTKARLGIPSTTTLDIHQPAILSAGTAVSEFSFSSFLIKAPLCKGSCLQRRLRDCSHPTAPLPPRHAPSQGRGSRFLNRTQPNTLEYARTQPNTLAHPTRHSERRRSRSRRIPEPISRKTANTRTVHPSRFA